MFQSMVKYSTRSVLELTLFPLERDRAVEELGSVLEYTWDSVLGEVPSEGAREIGEHESFSARISGG